VKRKRKTLFNYNSHDPLCIIPDCPCNQCQRNSQTTSTSGGSTVQFTEWVDPKKFGEFLPAKERIKMKREFTVGDVVVTAILLIWLGFDVWKYWMML